MILSFSISLLEEDENECLLVLIKNGKGRISNDVSVMNI